MQFFLLVSVRLTLKDVLVGGAGHLVHTQICSHVTYKTPASCAPHDHRNKKKLKESKWISGLHKQRALAALESKYRVMQGLVIRFFFKLKPFDFQKEALFSPKI